MTRHHLLLVVDTDEKVTAADLAEDVLFTMGKANGVAGGYIGEPDEHAFYKAHNIEVFITTAGGGMPL